MDDNLSDDSDEQLVEMERRRNHSGMVIFRT